MMSVLKQFNFTRTSLLTLMQELNEKVADQESKHFENTIRWHIGNILLFDEKLIFLSREKSHKIPKEYAELFSLAIKVRDWFIEQPSLEQLQEDLLSEHDRINSIDELF